MSDAINNAIVAMENASELLQPQARYTHRLLKESIEALQALQSGEPVAAVKGWFHGECVVQALDPEAVLPAGMALYAAPQPVVDVNQQLVEALKACEECLMFIHGGEPLRTDVPLKLAREALLSAGKGGEQP